MNHFAKQSLLIWIFLVSFLLAPGCDVIYGMLDKEGAHEKKLIGEIVPYQSNPVIEEIQTLLLIYGYNPGKVDGVWGVRTRDAIEKFQKDNGLKVSRMVGEETWEKLIRFQDMGFIEEGRLNVRLVQEMLKKSGQSPGKVDGIMGPQTKEAVKSLQRARGLKVDGKVGYQTLGVLAEYLNS